MISMKKFQWMDFSILIIIPILIPSTLSKKVLYYFRWTLNFHSLFMFFKSFRFLKFEIFRKFYTNFFCLRKDWNSGKKDAKAFFSIFRFAKPNFPITFTDVITLPIITDSISFPFLSINLSSIFRIKLKNQNVKIKKIRFLKRYLSSMRFYFILFIILEIEWILSFHRT